MNELKVFADYMRDFLNAVRDAKKAGKSLDEVAFHIPFTPDCPRGGRWSRAGTTRRDRHIFLPGDEPGSISLSASGGPLRKGPERLQGLLTADAPPALYR